MESRTKFYHGCCNPFADYKQRLDQIAKENQIPAANITCIVLSPFLQKEKLPEEWRWISYVEFFQVLRKELTANFASADPQFLTYLREFMETIERLGGKPCIDAEFQKVVQQKHDDCVAFLRRLETLRAYYRNEVALLQSTLNDKQLPEHFMPFKGPWKYPLEDYDELFESIYSNAPSEQELFVSIWIKLSAKTGKWRICCYWPKGKEKRALAWLKAIGVKHVRLEKPRPGHGSESEFIFAEDLGNRAEVEEKCDELFVLLNSGNQRHPMRSAMKE